MDALIVVHTEAGFMNPKYKDRTSVNRYDSVYDIISVEIGRQLDIGNKVYYLAEHSMSPESELIYPTIRDHFPNMEFISMDRSQLGAYHDQYLRVKEHLIGDEIEEVEVAGVIYKICVTDVYNLISRKNRLPSTQYQELEDPFYLEISEEMGWSREKFDEIFNAEFDVKIRDELTDKILKNGKDVEGLGIPFPHLYPNGI